MARRRTLMLRKGTILFHGTQAPVQFSIPKGPAWFSDSNAVADQFTTWNDYDVNGPRRILRFKVTSPFRLIRWDDSAGMQAFVESRGYERVDLEDLPDLVRNAGFDGWIIPDNYGPEAADILLSYPERGLVLLDTEWLDPEPEVWPGDEEDGDEEDGDEEDGDEEDGDPEDGDPEEPEPEVWSGEDGGDPEARENPPQKGLVAKLRSFLSST